MDIIIIIIIIKQENQLHVFRARCSRVQETIDSVHITDIVLKRWCLAGRWDDAYNVCV